MNLNLRPITINEFSGTFCKFTEENFRTLNSIFEVDIFKLRKGEIKYLYVTSALKICCTYLNKKKLKKLNLNQITFIDGFWYFKADLK